MAKRNSATQVSKPKFVSHQSEAVAVAEPVRKNTSQPAVATTQAAAPKDTAQSSIRVTGAMIAQRAYKIWQKEGGSEMENWLKAEREVRNIASI